MTHVVDRLTVICLTTLFSILLAGCGGRTFGGPIATDGGAWPDGAVSRPDGRVPDGSFPACEEERHVVLQSVRLDNLDPMHWTPLVEGQTLRFRAGLTYGGCDAFAGVGWWTEDNGRTISVVGRIWKAVGENLICPGVAMYGEEIIAVPNLTPGTTVVKEQTTQPDALSFVIEVTGCDVNQDCFCQQGGGQKTTGEECRFNCECSSDLLCLSHYGMNGPFSICGLNCSRNAQCPGGWRCDFTDDGADGVCWQGMHPDECGPDQFCPPGYTCLAVDPGGSFCQADFSMAGEGWPCECDEQCSVGLRCLQLTGDDPPECRAICNGQRQCPAGFFCADSMAGRPPLCWQTNGQ